MTKQHTPMPWVLSENVNDTSETPFTEFCIEDANDNIVMFLKNGELAAFIVRACNAHDELILALERFVNDAGWRGSEGTETHFQCEYCRVLSEDSSIDGMGHLITCPVIRGKEALAKAKENA